MKLNDLKTIEQLQAFLDGTQSVAFKVADSKTERYHLVEEILCRFSYQTAKKAEKGVVYRFLQKVLGYSRQQLTRLVRQYKNVGRVRHRPARNNGFSKVYLPEDIAVLRQLDEQHGRLNGQATRKLCQRAYEVFKDDRYARLSKISHGQLYNLRASKGYQRSGLKLEKTRPKKSSIGQRRCPEPNNIPGYLRLDTVHQGDSEKTKGLYYINAVDEVTQYECVICVEKISEHYLLPVLKEILDAFPFKILGFHTDNGSEYINRVVASLLQKLNIEFTKSRARRSSDNGLVEGKNGSIVRKIFGYGFMPGSWATQINKFNQSHLFPYLNYHRLCLYHELKVDKKGKEKRVYPYQLVMTPYDKFKSLPTKDEHLKPGLSFEELDKVAYSVSDEDAAKRMNQAHSRLFSELVEQRTA